MDLGIQGKVALVTGGSRGLGKVAALSLAREGVNVAICGRTQSTLDGTVAELEALGVSAQGVVADVTHVDAMPPLAQAVADGLGPIDILVNNAGGSRARQDIADLPLEDFKAAFDLNLFGSFQLMRAVIPHMRQQQWGRIINIASIYGREYGGNLSYMAAKSALISATKHAAISLVTDGVLVTASPPAPSPTPKAHGNASRAITPPKSSQTSSPATSPSAGSAGPSPSAISSPSSASQRADLITGSCIVVDGGQSYSMI